MQVCKEKLTKAGFAEIHENAKWKLEPAKNYFFTRNLSTLVAFRMPPNATETGVNLFKMVGTHTDSPCLRLAPKSKLPDMYGYKELTVQIYGGPLLHTWFDRDLTLAGKVIVRKEGKLVPMIWAYKDGSCVRIPNLAIHLSRS